MRIPIFACSISHDERSPSGLRWRTQLPLFPNLTAYSFTPLSPLKLLSSIRFFTALVDVLLQCRSLTDVAWHFSVTSIIAPIILRLTQVRNLTIDCLTATALLEWHNHIDLVNKLEGLHILNLEKLIPQHTPALSRSMSNLTRLTLGKHPWVSSSHLLTLLEGTPHLQHLDVHIDDYGPGSQAHSKAIDSLNGLGTSSTSIRNPGSEFTGLPQLKALVVRHNSISAELHFSRFLACIDTLAWKSELQSLEIDSAHGACTFNTTIAYLFAKHPTLRSFVASHIRVFSHEFLTVLNICPLLEYASFLAEKACVQRLLSLSENPTDSSFRGELEISGNWKLSTLKWRQR
ncbi:hypothetical protein BV25DRAFT_1994892 [Artomyces pyxidatus]|uniref:Uncharacterized protein n=1 Tax=Artomyces pyxidatus TaxID=48021 RepID=A0ACB8SNS2_9AGAM|nr:hypothetical protein BV25DRAFT_1994892 [Artomyces pyxidatus]